MTTKSILLALLLLSLSPMTADARQTPATPGQEAPRPEPPVDHSGHQMPSSTELPPFIPPVTDEDRRAAFPDVEGHTVHDNATNYFVLVDQVEWHTGGGARAVAWNTSGWIGKDRDRFWFRTEGDGTNGRVEDMEVHTLVGRQISTWWDVVGGVRIDMDPAPDQAWAAIGLQGLAPYWFEVDLTGYVGVGGRTQLRFETEYDLLLTNRLVLQPMLELDVNSRADPDRGLGAGLSSVDVGLRLRYEVRREMAPYIGVLWTKPFFGTARAAGEDEQSGTASLVVGGRFWF